MDLPKRHTESVLAMLMGLNKMRPPVPTRGRSERVLSESYLENIASIASMVSVRPCEDESTMDVDGQQGTKDVEFQGQQEDEPTMERAKSSHKVKYFCFADSHVEAGTSSYLSKLLKSHSGAKNEVPIPRRRPNKALESGSSHQVEKAFSTSTSKGHGNCSSYTLINNIHSGAKGKKSMKVRTQTLQDVNAHGEIAKRVSSQVKKSPWHQYLSGSYAKHGDTNANECGNLILPTPGFTANRNDMKQPSPSSKGKSGRFTIHVDWCLMPGDGNLLESINLREDSFYPEWGIGPRQSASILCLDSQDANPGSEIGEDSNILVAENLSEEISLAQHSGYASACSDIEVLSHNERQTVSHDCDLREKLSSVSEQLYSSVDSGVVVDGENEDLGLSLVSQISQQSEFNLQTQKDIDSTFHGFNASTEQVSPDSILESKQVFQEGGGTGLEQLRNDIHEQQLQFKNELSEPHSAGPAGLMVSGDEDFGFDTNYARNEEIMRICGTRESSRDFSYLVDVLSEMGSGTVLTSHPSLFDVLEKKYKKQESWRTSDRRLLFDRINSGLMELHGSFMDSSIASRSTIKRFLSLQSMKNIREELWTLLVSEERKARQKSSSKGTRNEAEWLESGREVDFAKDIGEGLIDELLSETVNTVLICLSR